jgi:hypothetical protein
MSAINSEDPLTEKDARFAELIMMHVIQPRLRIGGLKWKDRNSFQYMRRTEEDVSFPFV